jgi:hypothetical protein
MATKQVQISTEEIRKSKFFIATPCYGGQLNEPYFRSVIKLMTFFNGHSIPLAFGTIANESLVTRARNVLLAYFLASDYTHLLFIDADIEFNVEDVLKLYVHDKDVIVGAYPKKGVAWDRIRSNILDPNNKEKTLTDRDIAAYGSDYAINFKFINKEQKTIAVENGIIKLHDAGTGFMMIKREAILKMIKAYPEFKYNNDVNINNESLKDHFYAMFDTSIDPVDRRYLSEDYTFCRRWQEIGGDIWLDPSISLNHYGHFCFQGNPEAIINFNETQSEEPKLPNEVLTLELPD